MTGTRRSITLSLGSGTALLAAMLLPASSTLAGPVARVDVYDRTEDRALDPYRHDGRTYIVGRPGNEYAIRIRNCTGARVLAVVSVDGVNVVTGETASPDQSGYVIEPGGYVNIPGWRKDLNRTAAFYFSDPGDAYASRTGRPDDLGVIGVALFREREYRRQIDDAFSAQPAAPSAEGAAKQSNATQDRSAAGIARTEPSLGTGHGRREYSPVEHVEFERADSEPDQRVVLRYDRRENLVALGVLPPTRRWHEANPFPATLGFVPDP
jgi:hypothetical protein